MGGSPMATSGEETGDADARKRQMGRDGGSSSDLRSDNKKQRRDNSKKGGKEESKNETAAPLKALKRALKQIPKAQEEVIEAQEQVSRAQERVIEVKEQVCAALKNMSPDKHGKDAGRAGGVEAVVQALKEYKADPQVQQDGCAALWKLCRDGEACRRAGEAGAVEAVVEALKTYTDKVHAPVQVQACSALRVLCCGKKNTMRAEATGAIETTVKALKAHTLNAQVQREGCAALSVLFNDNTEILHRAFNARAVGAVVEALQAHPFDEKVQEEGCGALVELCSYCHQFQSSARDEGVLTTVKALKTHKANPRVMEKACAALQTLVQRIAMNSIESLAEEAGAVEAVVEALKAHPFDEKVQVKGCGAIVGLCHYHHKNKSRASDAGATETIVEALKTHCANAQVQGKACKALQSCLYDLPANQFENDERLVVEAGGIETIVHAMKAHRTDKQVQLYGCKVLWTLCADNDENTRCAGFAGGVEVALEALRTHTTDTFAKEGMHILWRMCVDLTDNDFLDHAVQLGAVSVVQDAIVVDQGDDGLGLTNGLEILNAVGPLEEVSHELAVALTKDHYLRENFFEVIEMSKQGELALGRAWGTNTDLSLDFTEEMGGGIDGREDRIRQEANRAREYELERRERLLAFGMGVLPRLGGGQEEQAGSTGASSKALPFDRMGRDVFKLVAEAYGHYGC